uniref:Uncharacterized protein n=1 Tax=Steinernema glaseri TaxID=37863 RepID=A0A1I7YR12_9BILA
MTTNQLVAVPRQRVPAKVIYHGFCGRGLKRRRPTSQGARSARLLRDFRFPCFGLLRIHALRSIWKLNGASSDTTWL